MNLKNLWQSIFDFFSTDELDIKFYTEHIILAIDESSIREILKEQGIKSNPKIKFMHPIFRIFPMLGALITEKLIVLNPYSVSFWIRYFFSEDKNKFLERIIAVTISHEIQHLKQMKNQIIYLGSFWVMCALMIFTFAILEYFSINILVKIGISIFIGIVSYWLYPNEIDARKSGAKDWQVYIHCIKINKIKITKK